MNKLNKEIKVHLKKKNYNLTFSKLKIVYMWSFKLLVAFSKLLSAILSLLVL